MVDAVASVFIPDAQQVEVSSETGLIEHVVVELSTGRQYRLSAGRDV